MMDKYESYKESGIKWMGKIPSNWLLTKNRYGFKKHNNGKNEKDDTPVLSLTTKGLKVKTNLSFGKSTESYIGHQLVEKGDIVFTPRDFDQTPILSDVSNYDGCISNLYIVDKVKKGVLNYFVNYYWYGLKYSVNYFKNFSHGIRHSFNRFQFDEIPLLIPPISEQKLICRYLDKKTEQIDKLIDKIQRKIELLKEQYISLINQYVTKGLDLNVEMKDSGVEWIGEIPKDWNLKKLKYLVSYNTDALTEDTDPNYSFNYIEIGDVNHIEGVNLKEKIIFNGSPSRARRIAKPNDVIISTVRTSLRAIGVIPEIPDVVCSTGFCVIRDRTGMLNQNFLSYSVKSEWFVSNVISNSYGASYPAINSSELVDLKIVLPPLKEQEKIVKKLKIKIQNFDDQIKFETKRINLLKEYSKSLVSSVVTGKVRIMEDMI